jgi:uncharacterized protein YjiS (DUF1127 family)
MRSLARLRENIAHRAAERRARKGLSRLLHAEEHLLRDMGITRDDVISALSQPADVEAGELLNRQTGRST